jgi:CHAT domain-containing protein
LRGELAEVVLFPAPDGRVVALGGMGRLGTFRIPQARVLARAVAQVVGLLPAHSTLATVLIGSGKGNLKVREAVTPFLDGFAEALNADAELKVDLLRFVETRLDRALEILVAVKESAARLNAERKGGRGIALSPAAKLVEGSGGTIPADFGCSMMLAALARASGESARSDVSGALDAVLTQLPDDLRTTVRERLRELHGKGSAEELMLRDVAMNFRLREPETDPARDDVPSRVAFWRNENDIHAAAITHSTTVTERVRTRRAPIVEKACERLQNPAADKLQEHAAELCRLLVLSDLNDVLTRSEALVVEVDRALARVQWEMLPAGFNGEPLGVTRPVARQLRTFYSPRPLEFGARQRLKAVVIGDPGGPDIGLEAAREEAVAVAELLREHRVETELLVGPPEDGTGAGELKNVNAADYFEVITLLLSGEFDIVHYTGHATFNPLAADRTVWVFKAGVLTAHELDGMERPPRLVVTNACLSSQRSQQVASANGHAEGGRQPKPRQSRPGGDACRRVLQAGGLRLYRRRLGDSFQARQSIRSGVLQSIACSGRQDRPAVCKARAGLYKRRQDLGAAWAAYQHYGDPTRSVLASVVQPENG